MTEYSTNHSRRERLPSEFRGADRVKTNPVKTVPRTWTKQELDWCVERRTHGWTYEELAEATGRSVTSVAVKMKRVTKSDDTYNQRNRAQKYEANAAFAEKTNCKTVLDLYAGNSWWRNAGFDVVTNDINEAYETDYHADAFALSAELYFARKTFDVVDLDPFGSAYDALPFACRMANNGLIVSFGEWGHLRWRRTDYVSVRYGIINIRDFIPDAFNKEVQRQCRISKKTARPYMQLKYGDFLRIYYLLEPYKETSQWDGDDDDNEGRLF
jgi:hypothetical protein